MPFIFGSAKGEDEVLHARSRLESFNRICPVNSERLRHRPFPHSIDIERDGIGINARYRAAEDGISVPSYRPGAEEDAFGTRAPRERACDDRNEEGTP
jgi:hypothetical protein